MTTGEFVSPALRPVLIVGAGRSGTNLLAMALGASDELINVYEQRYIWTKGMSSLVSDLRHPDSATPPTCAYIRQHLSQLASGKGTGVRIVDKTPANALRLAFCLRVFPEAKVVNIIRNPFDNIASRIVERQNSGQVFSIGQGGESSRRAVISGRVAHARTLIERGNIPLDRMPVAILDQLGDTLRIALTGATRRYAERVPGMLEIERTEGPIAALCHQWREITRSATRTGRHLPAGRYLELRYEEVVREPRQAGERITSFLELAHPDPVITRLCETAKPQTVGRAQHRLTCEQSQEIARYLAPELAFFGYEDATEARASSPIYSSVPRPRVP